MALLGRAQGVEVTQERIERAVEYMEDERGELRITVHVQPGCPPKVHVGTELKG